MGNAVLSYVCRYKGTLMNAFMFNTGVIILASFAVMQFCTQAFADYAHVTSIGSTFVGRASPSGMVWVLRCVVD